MNKLSEYFGEGEFDGRWAYVHALSYNKYAAQAVTDGGHTEFRLGEFQTEEQAEMACEDYVLEEEVSQSRSPHDENTMHHIHARTCIIM